MSQTTQIKYPEAKIIRRLSLWAPDPGSPNKERGNMTFALKGNNLEILVWTRTEAHKGKGPIRANMSLLQIMTFCDYLEKVAASPDKAMEEIPVLYPAKADPNNPTAKRELEEQSVLRVVRNSEGLMSVGLFDLKDDTRSRILFPFVLDRFTGILKSNGEPLDLAEVSSMVAKSYAKILRSIFIDNIEMTTNEENAIRYPVQAGGNRNGDRSAPKPAARSYENEGFADITY